MMSGKVPQPNPPKQVRSRETGEKIAVAVEDLLKKKPFEKITIAEIARGAGVSSGAIYARYASKDEILPHIYARYDLWAEKKAVEDFEGPAWDGLDFDGTIRQIVRHLIDRFRENTWLYRAMALFARARPDLLPTDAAGRRGRYYDAVLARLSPYYDQAASPGWRDRARFATYALATLAREAIVFADAPMAASGGFTLQALEAHLIDVLRNHLPPPDEQRKKRETP